MRSHSGPERAFGVDIGTCRCSAVVLDASRTVVDVRRIATPKELTELARGAVAIGIDAPPRWARRGERSRPGERALARRGISCFYTPDRERGTGHPFYRWMEVGFAYHRAARRTGAPVLETFPNATAIVLGGRARRGESKTKWRRRVLSAHGVDETQLPSLDDVDAALCALTAWLWHEGGTETLGDELVVPCQDASCSPVTV